MSESPYFNRTINFLSFIQAREIKLDYGHKLLQHSQITVCHTMQVSAEEKQYPFKQTIVTESPILNIHNIAL